MYSFEEIMKFHNDNINVYNEIKRNLPMLVPFVGAGLSQFAYYSWSALLTELTKNITNRNDLCKIKGLIKQGGKHYLEVAQCLEDLRMPSNLARDIANLFSPEKLNDKKDQLTKEPIWLLPLLFSGFVITTNFDQTLENVYANNHHLCKIFEHNQLSLLNQYLNQVNDYPGIFKIHGTVSGDYIEYDHIVFTENQYKKFYGDGSTLTEALKKCLEQKTILFLGCSLSQDCTIDILESVLEEGKSYYTIINCKKSERDQKIRELGDKHIRAIVYEGKRHEAVRVILEHLLEETNPDAYKALDYHVGALTSLGTDNRFTYDAGIFPFVGREVEMSELNSFLGDTKTAFKWWAVTGPGGCGKSRLAYEFKNQLSNDWKAKYLGSEDYDNLFGLADKLSDKTLLIADYVQEHAKELGKLMAKLNNDPRNLPLRVLLIEREANDESGVAPWVTQLYSNIHNETELKRACYGEFLSLHPLSDDNLKIVIKNYAAAMSSKYNKDITLSEKKTATLLQKLKTIDTNLCRPLYAMFLTDAYIEGNNPEQWNRKDILDYIIGRENKKLSFSVGYIMGSEDSKLFSACKYFLCVATVFQDISVDNLKELCPEKWDIVEKKAERFETPKELLTKIGLVVKDEVTALRPNLIGEYYVFDWLTKQQKNVARDFINNVWINPLVTGVFFDRIIKDYYQFLNEKQENWDTVIPHDLDNLREYYISLYMMLLENATCYCTISKQNEKYASSLEKFMHKYPKDTEVALYFAQCLFNLSNRQETQNAMETINRLEKLAFDYPNAVEISVEYAKSLFNLSNRQDYQNALNTINRLELLALEHPKVTEIVIEYANGLVNLGNRQEEQNELEIIYKLEKLTLEYFKVTELAVAYAVGLANLSCDQDEQNATETINRLEQLTMEYPEITRIATAYANGLFNLSCKQDEQKAAETINRLEKLTLEYSNVTKIAAMYAKGMYNLICDQNEQKATETVKRLEKLTSEHYEVIEIVKEYVKSLVILSFMQDEKKVLETDKKLKRLLEDYPEIIVK